VITMVMIRSTRIGYMPIPPALKCSRMSMAVLLPKMKTVF
jgi:hypothetical protein